MKIAAFSVRRFAGIATIAILGLVSTPALAAPITFSGSGAVTGPAQTPPVLSGLVMSGSTSSYVVDGVSGWFVDKLFGFNTATLTGGGTFTLSNGVSSLFGSFTSSRASSTSPLDLVYTVSGGTGLFAGYIGTGTATGATAGNPFGLPTASVTFREEGVFELRQVPEPASAWLMLTALGGLLGRRLRQRSRGQSRAPAA